MPLPFSINPQCSKCETDNVIHNFHAANACPLDPLEHIHLTCQTCGYQWAEEPGDKAV